MVNRKLIFSGEDQYTKLEVFDTRTLRNLHFGTSIIQSSMFLQDPYELEMEYNQVMMLALLYHSSPQSALFLGLGGGSMPKFLWRYFPKIQQHTVEISPLVIQTAKKFFLLPEDNRLSNECISAEKYMEKVFLDTFDLIFVDLFLSNQMAKAPIDPEFFISCKERLNEGGILVWNVWSSTPPHLLVESFQQIKSLFENVFLVQVEESPNLILIGMEKSGTIDLENRAKELTAQTGLDFAKLMKKKRIA